MSSKQQNNVDSQGSERRIIHDAASSSQTTTARVNPFVPDRSASYRSNNAGSNTATQQSYTNTAEQSPSPSTPYQRTGWTQPVTCPYHGPIIQMLQTTRSQQRNVSPMDRFLAEGPSEAYAVLMRADTGRLSTSRGCTCHIGMGNANQNRIETE